uniref:BET1 homolog n=1 Tax=Corethrella appendiculata TaxID=1370023 RepID=U5EW94_9DIPT
MRRAQGGYNYQPLPQHSGGINNSSNHDALEEENERMAEELQTKIGALKSLTIDIGNEVKYQDKYLQGLDDDMDRTGGFLSNTMNRVIRLGKGGHRNYMCYMFLFVMFIFFILFLILKFR